MLRKPQPKEAARAVRELLLSNGFEVSNSLTLEIVAKVEGYDDWNTFVADNPAHKRRVEKTPPPVVGQGVTSVVGPFKVIQNGKVVARYDVLEDARRKVSSLISPSSREWASGFNDVDITAANNVIVACAIHPATRYRVYVDGKPHENFWALDEFLDSLVNLRQDYGDRHITALRFDLPDELDIPGFVGNIEPTLLLDYESLTKKMHWICRWYGTPHHREWNIPRRGFDDDLGVALDEITRELLAAGYPAPSKIIATRVENDDGLEVFSLDHWRLEIPGHPEMDVQLSAQYYSDQSTD